MAANYLLFFWYYRAGHNFLEKNEKESHPKPLLEELPLGHLCRDILFQQKKRLTRHCRRESSD